MNSMHSFLLLVALVVAPDAMIGDMQKLQGTWITVSLIDQGKTLVDEKAAPTTRPSPKLRYEGNMWHVVVGDKVVASGVFRIDESQSPKQFDVLDESGQLNEKAKLAIYELDGDTFRYCIARAGQPRPTEFKSTEGSGHSLITSKREKQ